MPTDLTSQHKDLGNIEPHKAKSYEGHLFSFLSSIIKVISIIPTIRQVGYYNHWNHKIILHLILQNDLIRSKKININAIKKD